MKAEHNYRVSLVWEGNTGEGSKAYDRYKRDFLVHSPGKAALRGSSDPAFRGDPARYNPEELFLASLSSCHMLWYLHLCATGGVVVNSYRDEPEGRLVEFGDPGGQFTAVVLQPIIQVSSESMIDEAIRLHNLAHKKCFIANSCKVPIHIRPKVSSAGDTDQPTATSGGN